MPGRRVRLPPENDRVMGAGGRWTNGPAGPEGWEGTIRGLCGRAEGQTYWVTYEDGHLETVDEVNLRPRVQRTDRELQWAWRKSRWSQVTEEERLRITPTDGTTATERRWRREKWREGRAAVRAMARQAGSSALLGAALDELVQRNVASFMGP